eukprot:TRINITY_DN6175_c0_g1_i1.p1 TRINITY_DN6175_c0_g1~~TRINITY_DN6175_c0_g1_i1.p1  ORF type:complete len:522 (+),score=61.29 TRINITY_DN6175_c0_g1_i1:193-1566(+)
MGYAGSLRTWPPYEGVLGRGTCRQRDRLHTRDHDMLTMPPEQDWTSSVMADWLTQMYIEVGGPLEPFIRYIRRALDRDFKIADLSERSYHFTIKLPVLATEAAELMREDLTEELYEKYEPFIRRAADYYEPANPLRRLLCDSWVWWWHGPPNLIVPLAFECFVEQPSPCCAAASAAGSINMLLKRPRPSYTEPRSREVYAMKGRPTSFTAVDAIAVMDRDLVDMINKSIGAACVDLSTGAAEMIASRIGREMSPHGSLHFPPPTTKAQQKKCLEAIRKMLIDLNTIDTDKYAALRWLEDGSRPKCKPSLRSVYTLVSNIWGLAKLRCFKPSTARFGSWGVVMAIERLSTSFNLGTTAVTQVLTEYTFEEFRQLVLRPNCSVVLHLPNHYAVVFAFKGDFILTARKGQPPTDLISWEELIKIQQKSTEGIIVLSYLAHAPPPLRSTTKLAAKSKRYGS